MIKWIACGLLAIFIGAFVNGQSEVVDTIHIEASNIRKNNFGGSSILLKSKGSLSNSLVQNGAVFLKNYGPGSLSTSSIRGGSASHTLVLWNDLPIQNPFLGLLDLSLLDTWAMNNVSLQKGGNAAMWGSGAIGGVLSMDQKNESKGKWSVSNDLSFASFGRIHERAKLSVGIRQLTSITSYSNLLAKNNFPYKSTNDEVKLQTNAAQKQENFNQDFYWAINERNELAFHYWRSRSRRENPPTTVQTRSRAYQVDKSDRFSAQWKYVGEKNKIKVNTGYFIEDLNYFDPQILLISATHFETFVLDITDEVKFRTHHVMNFGLSNYRTEVSSPTNYSSIAKESRIAAFIRYQYKWIQMSLRQEIVDDKLTPLIPAIAFETPTFKHFKVKGKLSRNYRLPTLNDKFWEPGGNPNLLPESGWSQEVSLTFLKSRLFTSLTVFNRVIDNWIQWSLLAGENTLSPYNLNRVWSRGVEVNLNYEYKALNLRGGYNFIRSTNTKATVFPMVAIGDQLFYTPIHSGHVDLSLHHKKWRLSYMQRFNGKTLGINSDLKPWTVGDFALNLTYKSFGFYGNIFNIWNTSYRIIERRPMPGRHFELGLKINIEKK